MLLVARTGTDERTGRAQISLFLVDCDAEGIERAPIPMEITSPDRQFTLFFNDVRVPADRLIGVEGGGLRALFLGLNPERIISAAYSNGLARYALEKGLPVRPGEVRLGGCRSAATRPSHTPSRRPRSGWSSRA